MRWLLLIPFALLAGCCGSNDKAQTAKTERAPNWSRDWDEAKKALPQCDPLDLKQHTYICNRLDGKAVIQLGPSGTTVLSYIPPPPPDDVEAQHACEVLKQVYSSGRIKIEDSKHLIFWCSFDPPRAAGMKQYQDLCGRGTNGEGTQACLAWATARFWGRQYNDVWSRTGP